MRAFDSNSTLCIRLQRLFTNFFAHTDNVSLVTGDGRPLFFKSRYIADTASLAESVSLVSHWVPLQPGQLVIFNDRSLSGTAMSALTLIYRLPRHQLLPSHLYLCQRIYTQPNTLGIENSINTMVIPPTPITDKGILNKDVIVSISSHPLMDSTLNANFEKILQSPIQLGKRLISLLETLRLPLSDATIRQYFREELQFVQNALTHIPEGSTSTSLSIGEGRSIQLHLEFSRGRLSLDFTGTPAAPFSLNAQLTFAACLSALTKILLSKHQLLAGLSHSLNVIAPENTFVNGGPIASVYGIYEGAAWIEQAICQAFSQYSPQYQTAQHGLSGCPVIFRFPMHSPLFIISPLGMAGSVVYRGRNAVYIGNDPTNIFNVMSLEDGQNPIQLRSFHLRRNSGGKGKHSGGCGFVQTFSIQQDGEIEWVYSDERAKGALGGKAGTSAALQVRRGQREWEDLPTQGLQSISPGDEISILSSGGGGFGPPGSVT